MAGMSKEFYTSLQKSPVFDSGYLFIGAIESAVPKVTRKKMRKEVERIKLEYEAFVNRANEEFEAFLAANDCTEIMGVVYSTKPKYAKRMQNPMPWDF